MQHARRARWALGRCDLEPRLVPGSLVRAVVDCDVSIGVSMLLWAMLETGKNTGNRLKLHVVVDPCPPPRPQPFRGFASFLVVIPSGPSVLPSSLSRPRRAHRTDELTAIHLSLARPRRPWPPSPVSPLWLSNGRHSLPRNGRRADQAHTQSTRDPLCAIRGRPWPLWQAEGHPRAATGGAQAGDRRTRRRGERRRPSGRAISGPSGSSASASQAVVDAGRHGPS